MAGLYPIFATNDFLSSCEQLSNCHVVIDGSNIQYFFADRRNALSSLQSYAQAVRDYFHELLEAKITPHVFFDGPSSDASEKWERARRHRQDRLEMLAGQHPWHEFSASPAISDIFHRVLDSMAIRKIQVSAKRDYTDEMISHAKYFNATLISGNLKFYVEDLPCGFSPPSSLSLRAMGGCRPRSSCVIRIYRFQRFRDLINLGESPNPHALRMWITVLYNKDVFGEFSKHFLPEADRSAPFYPTGRREWIHALLSSKNRRSGPLKLLQFFLENTYDDASHIIYRQLYPNHRTQAKRLFRRDPPIEAHDVFEKIRNEVETGEFCHQHLPQWFLSFITVECKLVPDLLDTLTNRRHYLKSLVEDFEKKSAHDCTISIRRLIYGVLLADCEESDEDIFVEELDRRAEDLQEVKRRPRWKMWSPGEESEDFLVPGLKSMDSLSESERRDLFLLGMGVERKRRKGIDSDERLYITAILINWLAAGNDIRRADLLRVLLTALIVEWKYGKPSNIFDDRVRLDAELCARLAVDFRPESVKNLPGSFACMHPLAQLHSVMFFGRCLHRLFMQPLGPNSDSVETVVNEVVFYHICQLTQNMDDVSLEEFIIEMVTESGRGSFENALDALWDRDSKEIAETIIEGFVGDDKRS
ncbi:uncharacterized protein LOC100898804 [Galendromus occidentalis]|uniref:Uncharacterized protein LOC100898804 n=1 Tax=Galendromus occidentalis TaxID=34638 RepID=A0AAJ6QY95_9ACAR|nr:uncharacterized protein LOC100898804 [Galendromus occidentalis]